MYAYAREDLDWWVEQLGLELPNGTFGENLTTAGLDVSGALLGETWRVGTRGAPGPVGAHPVWRVSPAGWGSSTRPSAAGSSGSPRQAGPAPTSRC